MKGMLLDTHALLWLANGLAMTPPANRAIVQAQSQNTLFTSPITAWEIGVSNKKRDLTRRPPLSGLTPDIWFRTNLRKFDIRLVAITEKIAIESAEVTSLYGSGDPGDCFLIATAHTHSLTLITRDTRILDFAVENPGYLSAVRC